MFDSSYAPPPYSRFFLLLLYIQHAAVRKNKIMYKKNVGNSRVTPGNGGGGAHRIGREEANIYSSVAAVGKTRPFYVILSTGPE